MRAVSRFIVCSIALAVLTWQTATPAARPAADEVRGLWVLRSSLGSPQSIAAMVRAARDAGFNTLLVQVRGRGEAHYKSAIEPRASELDGQPADFDPLATTLDLARRAGLAVHAWVNVNLVASATTLPRSRNHIALRHPEWLMVPAPLAGTLGEFKSPAYIGALARWSRSAGEQVEGLYLSPIPAEAQEYTAAVVAELAARYAVDGIHLDYVRYPNEAFDHSRTALSAFRQTVAASRPPAERQELDRATAHDPTAWVRSMPDAWATLRRDRLTDLVVRLRSVVKKARPGAVVSAAVVPDADQARGERFQDWASWASRGLLDVVCPMAYTTDANEFASQVARARTVLADTPLWTGIGAYRLPAATTAERIRMARRAGTAGVLVFSYDSVSSGPQAAGYFAELRSTLQETMSDRDK
jgi:uncharacterized lipoprotein YddW (UPF0748 family)